MEFLMQMDWATVLLLVLSMLPLLGATLAANTPRIYEGGSRNEHPVIASDIIFEGAAVGLVDGTGHARPLNAADRFAGFAEAKADNASGSAADINVRVVESGKIVLSITGAVITDVGQPIYATDDNVFVFNPVGGVFIGYVHRFISAGKVVVAFDAQRYQDPHGAYTKRETLSANKTLDAEDSGKMFWVDTDAFTITLPVVAVGTLCKIVNGGAFGTIAVTVAPAAADSIEGPDITAADNTARVNTKATARRGDFIVLGDANADGYIITELKGIWA